MKTSLKTFGKEYTSYSTVKKWATEFRMGRDSVEDDERSGHPKDATTDENVKVVHTLVMCDRRRDLRSIASEVGVRFGVVQSILTDILGMSKVLARWVPQMLPCDQKRTGLDISMYLLSCNEDDPGDFNERVVIQDDNHFDPESKMQLANYSKPLQRNLRGFIQQGR